MIEKNIDLSQTVICSTSPPMSLPPSHNQTPCPRWPGFGGQYVMVKLEFVERYGIRLTSCSQVRSPKQQHIHASLYFDVFRE